ncbi:MAG: sulfite exporter TauE/SafE family protein [Pirellulaceae bacterium]|nr:sulfite exporter TauE/SafE family protein [Pirellulaceae bacterium]
MIESTAPSAPTLSQLVLLCAAAALAGIVNSIAGGGTLLTFPALTMVLGPSAAAAVIANATSTMAVFPGSLASAWGYRRELVGMKSWIMPLIIPSLVGSAIGTSLVAQRDPQEFLFLIPWLILLASCLFLLQPMISKWTGIGQIHASPSKTTRYGIIAFQFLIAFYGGYFGAGIGILMLSALALMGISDIHQMNSIKTLLASTINSVSVALFIWHDKIYWSFAIPMIVTSILGGFLGAVVARRLDRNVVRYIVVTIGISLSCYYFIR